MTSRLTLLAALATLAVLEGCKKESPAAPPPAPVAAPTPPPAPVRKDPLAEVPASDSTLSVLEPSEGRCEWSRVDPVAQKRAGVASFEGDCKGARLAWNRDLSRMLVWIDPTWVRRGAVSPQFTPPAHPQETPTPGAPPRLYELTVASGQVRTLPFPAMKGELRGIGYTAEGISALVQVPISAEQRAKGSITLDGQGVSLTREVSEDEADDGEIIRVASVYRLMGDGVWKNVFAIGLPSNEFDNDTFSLLGTHAALGPLSEEMLDSSLDPEESNQLQDMDQDAVLLPLLPARTAQTPKAQGLPVGDSGSWHHAHLPGGAHFAVWSYEDVNVKTTGHLAFVVGGQPLAAKDLGFTDGDAVAVRTQGPFVLVASERVGTHPRVYDARTGKLVFRSDTARSATFWPSPAAAR